jgi:rSAM/selenodomain-associated transferase 2
MISIIIPTLNEERRLPSLLAALQNEDTPHQTIVVDGGSRDDTISIARQYGIRVVRSPPGRGTQICAGVQEATGDVLLFLHADTMFPTEGLRRIEQTLASYPEVVGGNFRLLFDGGTPFSRWLTGFYAFIRRRGLYYGDSGIFARRSAYDSLGGMRPIAIMEDFDFVRRLERSGRTFCITDPPLITSSRRFAGRRPIAIVYGWLKIHALFYAGVSPTKLAAIYAAQARRRRGKQRRQEGE